jgi:hypothetical protein
MTHEGVLKILWRLGLVAAPLVLIGVELFHPAHFIGDPGIGAIPSHGRGRERA